MAYKDRRDPTRAEMLLTRAIHHLWHLRAKLTVTHLGRVAFDEALETLFQAKRDVKAAIRAKNAIDFAKRKHLFAKRKSPCRAD